MNRELVDRIAAAVLYEGYILYPYRPSVKNRQRWTFGGLYPQSYSLAQGGTDAWTMQTECLVVGDERSTLDVTVRFLHLMLRQIGELTPAKGESGADASGSPFRPVESLEVDGERFHTWQESVERTIGLERTDLGDPIDRTRVTPFRFPALRERKPLRRRNGEIAGILLREQQAIEGAIELSAERAAEGLFKVRVRIVNRTPLEEAAHTDREEALLRSLVSTHTILGVKGGEFVSLFDPPEPWRAVAAGCRNEGAWPVLVGEGGEKDTMLSAPIILYDYPQIAAESPGDLFDGTEIDEILTLRILTLTDEEKQAAAAVDLRAAMLLKRTEALAREQLLGLHATMRVVPTADDGGRP